MKNILLTMAFALLVTTLFSCDLFNETEELKPGRRDYAWTVDTVKTFNTPLIKMWGTSPTNVWAVGHGSSLDQTIWHYDGTKWKTDNISRPISPWCIHGFAENDIWVGGEDGEIWHYDGNNWNESLSYSKELNYHYYNIYFMDIWGENPNDVYAVGFADSSDVGLGDVRFGIMMHYDGEKWSRVNIEFLEGIFMGIRKGIKTSNKYFMRNVIQFPDSTMYYSFDGKNINEIYHDIGGTQTLTVIDDEILFNFDIGAYIFSNNTFRLIANNPIPNSWDAIYGRNRKDIIWMMSDGLTHYNGSDFEYILNFDKKSLSDGVVFQNEVFFVANNFYNSDANNVIYHGVLK